MSRSLREALAIVLTIFMTFGPALSANADCCGWYSYSPPAYDCCGGEVVVDCCGCTEIVEECCEPVVVEESSCGCDSSEVDTTASPEVMVETAKPALADPSPANLGTPTPQPMLEPEEDVADADPTPMAEEPMTVDQPMDSPVTPPITEPDPTPVPTATEAPAPLFEPAEEAVEEPAAEPAGDDGFDDMFGEPAEEDPTPVEEESDDSFDDMFGAPAEEAPAEEPAMEESDAGDDLDDMFGAPAEDSEPAAEEAPAEEEPASEEPASEEPAESDDEGDFLDDFFSSVEVPAELQLAGGLRSNELRQWTDNTARYHCEARLVGTAPGEIVLHKANGKLKRVSLGRLSEKDLQFVYSQVAAHKELLAKQSNAKKLASR